MKKRKNDKKKPLILVAVLLLLIAYIGVSAFTQIHTQERVDGFVQKAGYPEMKQRIPVFTQEIKTPDSTTYVISYLPSNILSKERLNAQAAKEAIVYVEKIAKDENSFVFRPFYNQELQVNVKMVPKWQENAEHYVFFFSDKDQIPNILMQTKNQYPLLSDLIRDKKTFFWTTQLKEGSVSFIRFSESETFKYGIPTAENKGTTTLQQLNIGFNIEIWKRASVARPNPESLIFNDHSETLFGANESLWNTFGQLIAAKQEAVPKFMLERRYNKNILSKYKDRAYYPFDEKAQRIYENAPRAKVIH